MIIKEIWREVKDTKGYYQVSNIGNVRSMPRRASKGGLLKSLLYKKNGYYIVKISVDGKEKRHFVHKLVAQAFIPNPENKPQVNHRNGNKLDNRVSNLEWVTCKENIEHAYKHGLHKTQQVIQFKENKIIKVFRNCHYAGKQTGISYPSIYYCLVGKKEKAGGYEWCYVNSLMGRRLLAENKIK